MMEAPNPTPPGSAGTGWVEPQKVDYSAYNDESNQHTKDFDGAAPIYQWNDEFGDVGPKFEALELELFGDSRQDRAGLDFSK
jgi:ATP-dependent RNA helicase DDX3X